MYQTLENTCFWLGKHLFQTLENTFVKRWTIPLSNVGKHFCQTLGNTFVKRWTIFLSDIRKELKILYRLGQPPIYT